MKEPTERADVVELRALVQQLVRGRSNAVGSVTLSPGAAVTTVKAPHTIGANSRIQLTPRTATAAAALATTYVATVANGTFVLAHANTTSADRTFDWAAIG